MLWQALRNRHHHQHEVVGFVAGLIPCPLTLFVMTFAISRGVPEAGIIFAAAMLAGVALTLSSVAMIAAFFRVQVSRLLQTRPMMLQGISRWIEAIAGALLMSIALREILH